ncbi:MAG: ABC transporter ATP-binding protein [Anaerolineae bacterium]|nr:ABC transporter ATP-binding protein [Anaerolineae bacterium]
MTVLETDALSIGYQAPRQPSVVIAENIMLSLQAGELVCLMGPNGAGKSTLLRTLAGVQQPLAGEVLLLNHNVHQMKAAELAQMLSLVLTDRPHVGLLTGYELVALGRHPYTDWTGRLSKKDEEVVRWAVGAVNAEDVAARPVSELSDGQRQKIMIARALAQEPALMILDEPTAFLDIPRRVEVMRLLKSITRQTGRTILLATHDLDLALRTADRVWLLAEGKLHSGAPEDLVLNGAFERAFYTEGVRFDAASGSFNVTSDTCLPIKVSGEGLAALWTRRALERTGYHLTEEAALHVSILDSDGDPRWQLNGLGESQTFTRLYDLVQTLSRIPAPPTKATMQSR